MLKILIGTFLTFYFVCIFSGYSDAERQKINFSCDKNSFQEERKFLHQKYKKEYLEIEGMAKAYEEEGETPHFKDRDICIAKTDLNHDGIEDVFLHADPGGFSCGTAGCLTSAYFIGKDGEWNNVLTLYSYFDGVWLADLVNGYRALQISQKIACPCDTRIHADGTQTLINTKDFIYIYDLENKRYKALGSDKK